MSMRFICVILLKSDASIANYRTRAPATSPRSKGRGLPAGIDLSGHHRPAEGNHREPDGSQERKPAPVAYTSLPTIETIARITIRSTESMTAIVAAGTHLEVQGTSEMSAM